jgi:hypothetical protein
MQQSAMWRSSCPTHRAFTDKIPNYKRPRAATGETERAWPSPKSFACMFCSNYAQERGGAISYDEEWSQRRDDAGSKIAHETNDALTLPGHARTPSGCKSGDINERTIIKKEASVAASKPVVVTGVGLLQGGPFTVSVITAG